MNFLILGCSWGVPNYSGLYGDPIDTHTEYLLKAKGHNVINCAGNGASNLQSLDRANLYLAGKPIRHPAFPEVKTRSHLEDLDIKIDWVIWFQTAFLRDDKSVLPSETLIKDIAQLTYSRYQSLFKKLKSKVALVGGNSDLHPCYKEYIDPEFVIKSWRSTILGQEPVEFDINDPELEFKFIDNELQLQNLKNNSKFFPDNHHPGAIAHANLVTELLECATNSNSQKN